MASILPRGVIALAASAMLALCPAMTHASEAGADDRALWREVAWPFPIDQWGTGSAFRCAAADCGTEIVVYLRPKIGFCNCTTGVSDDDELDRVADVSLFDDRYAALGDGHAIKVGRMEGRSRPYVVDAGSRPRVLAIGFNQRCDVIAATALVASAEPARFEGAVLAFLNSDQVMRWVAVTLGS
jgi:hypothetical protein